MEHFELVSDFVPTGDQPGAIAKLVKGIQSEELFQTLLGVTGSGKTYTIANVISKVNKPALIISHNKTLAAQLFGELRSFFPRNAVEYFISYYDYYQPEAYVPQTDTYIEKDAQINEEIDRLRLRATSSLIERRDVVVIASVSCIFGLGSPAEYRKLLFILEKGDLMERDELLEKLVGIQYSRNDTDFYRGRFRVRGDVVEIYPAYEDRAIRVEFFGDEIERIHRVDPLTGEIHMSPDRVVLYPAKHFVTSPPRLEEATVSIRKELEEVLPVLEKEGKLLEAERLRQRTLFDLEMLQEVGYCTGIENYSRHLTGRKPGERPACLLDYFQGDFLTIIDESHVTIPQINGMYNGDRSRKTTLVEYGFRLPSALDNRPLRFHEFEKLIGPVIFVSATPAEYELERSKGVVVEQIIRPTGLMDPKIEVKPTAGQIDHLIGRIHERVKRNERVLVTTLTKRMAEDLTDYLLGAGIHCRYLHSEIQAIDRVEIIRDLRTKKFDVLVGINLLREGLDLPEVSLVAILDADKEGFLRSERALIQTAGRAARNVNGTVIMYADKITVAMARAIDETDRRRKTQKEYNRKKGIVPRTITKSMKDIMGATTIADSKEEYEHLQEALPDYEKGLSDEEILARMEADMKKCAENLEFEKAARLRDELYRLYKKLNIPWDLSPDM
jgi:excinuclease ABC subunit B